MSLLRTDFINADNCPDGCAYIPFDENLDAGIQAARMALLNPEISCVVIARRYPDLAAIARQALAELDRHDPGKKTGTLSLEYKKNYLPQIFSNSAGKDFIQVMAAFSEQKFKNLGLVAWLGEVYIHIDEDSQLSPFPKNILKNLLPGSVDIVQPLSICGTGIYGFKKLKEIEAEPVYSDLNQWQFFNEDHPDLVNLQPGYSRPGDIVIIRKANWPMPYSPSVHVVPVCNVQTIDRIVHIAHGHVRNMAHQ